MTPETSSNTSPMLPLIWIKKRTYDVLYTETTFGVTLENLTETKS